LFHEYLLFLPFQVLSPPSCTAMTALPRMSGFQFTRPQSTGFVWGQCWSLITHCNQSKNNSLSLKMHCRSY